MTCVPPTSRSCFRSRVTATACPPPLADSTPHHPHTQQARSGRRNCCRSHRSGNDQLRGRADAPTPVITQLRCPPIASGYRSSGTRIITSTRPVRGPRREPHPVAYARVLSTSISPKRRELTDTAYAADTTPPPSDHRPLSASLYSLLITPHPQPQRQPLSLHLTPAAPSARSIAGAAAPRWCSSASQCHASLWSTAILPLPPPPQQHQRHHHH